MSDAVETDKEVDQSVTEKQDIFVNASRTPAVTNSNSIHGGLRGKVVEEGIYKEED